MCLQSEWESVREDVEAFSQRHTISCSSCSSLYLPAAHSCHLVPRLPHPSFIPANSFSTPPPSTMFIRLAWPSLFWLDRASPRFILRGGTVLGAVLWDPRCQDGEPAVGAPNWRAEGATGRQPENAVNPPENYHHQTVTLYSQHCALCFPLWRGVRVAHFQLCLVLTTSQY